MIALMPCCFCALHTHFASVVTVPRCHQVGDPVHVHRHRYHIMSRLARNHSPYVMLMDDICHRLKPVEVTSLAPVSCTGTADRIVFPTWSLSLLLY
ncbi:hypothetical protein L210DRAFT_3592274 [Boletus edulis BED1]|uniref:Secreted protein n=1 Tax=Boletus edulis BED1 TaxID=1328754 RepID=A0AAD4B8Q9_BOLED|nr:hypothetical protein L210DRAFT_3592274 [Boletus edulis BED1]